MAISNCLACTNDTFCTQCSDNLVFNPETINCEEPIAVEISEDNNTENFNNTYVNNTTENGNNISTNSTNQN